MRWRFADRGSRIADHEEQKKGRARKLAPFFVEVHRSPKTPAHVWLELEAERDLDRAVVVPANGPVGSAVLCTRGRTEAGIARRQAVGDQRAIRVVLRIAHGEVGRAVVLNLRLARVDDVAVKRVERIQADLEVPPPTEPDVPR